MDQPMPVRHRKAKHVLDIARYFTLAQHNHVVVPSDLGSEHGVDVFHRHWFPYTGAAPEYH
jgi:hypothetical protein